MATLTGQERLARRTVVTQPLWDEPRTWLQLERTLVHDGTGVWLAERRLNSGKSVAAIRAVAIGDLAFAAGSWREEFCA
ncbi:hypothetical protein J2W23_006246 [Variovorax boronicumulans]|nr:hypothetical protein [Variovorax boronicumulans]MDQ0017830.1 hypothetical protein [Variovorax boronicumulans]